MSSSWLVGLLQLLLLAVPGLAAQAQQHAGFGRRLLIRPMPGGLNTCRNTNQGPWFMTDDKGKVCGLKDMDFTTGCCSSGEKHYCGRCDKVDCCCESFEHCVSCCMAPENSPDERRLKAPRMPNHADSGHWADAFEYCLATCRTHRTSTSHENAYIGPRHHCFSKLGKPMMSPPLPAGALDGVTVVLSAAGASCSSMCEGKSLSCSASHLHLLNSCDQLREVTDCEAGCQEEEHSDSLPAAVDLEAPKQDRPALCLVSKGPPSGAKGFSCSATANYMRRLCPCVKADAAGGEAAAAGGAKQEQLPEDKPAAATDGAGAEGGKQQPAAAGKDESAAAAGGAGAAAGGDTEKAAAAEAGEQQQQQQQGGGAAPGDGGAAGGPGEAGRPAQQAADDGR